VGVVAAGTATAQTLSRARILAGDRVRISELAPEAECPQHQPPSALQPMPVDLLQLAPECVPPWDAQGPAETPWDACRAALQALAAVEPALVIAGDVAPWQPLDQWALVALAQVAAEGRRVVLLRPDPAVLASLAARLADLQLHCVVLTDHPEAPGDDRWWWTEAADQAQALAQLRTALWVEGLWCLRVPSRWCQGLTEPGPWAEPGAQRTVMAGKGPLLVASCGYLDQAQRLGAESGGALSVLHASSLQPGPVGPWAALEGDPVLAACGGGTPVPASLAGLRAWLGSDGHS
ncbi:MAG: hypothetical protein PF961_09535, partial [Planctomycetota bacterium]|nr:hypothetical protein [Planctomycetota bacterium]